MMALSLLMLFKRNYEKETEDLKDRNRLTIGVEFTSDCSPLNHMNRVCPIEKAIIIHSDRAMVFTNARMLTSCECTCSYFYSCVIYRVLTFVCDMDLL